MIEGWVEEHENEYKRVKAPLGGLLESYIFKSDNDTYYGVFDLSMSECVFQTEIVNSFGECAAILESWLFNLVSKEYEELKKMREKNE